MTTTLAEFEVAVRRLQPTTAIVLGSGLGAVPYEFQPAASVLFAKIPGLVAPGVAGHQGTVAVGTCRDHPLMVFHGRLHYYEGHSWEMVARPVETAARWGIRQLILTNAAGGIRADLAPGSLMLIQDHLMWQRPRSWVGPGPEACACLAGNRPSCYSSRLGEILNEAANAVGIHLARGIYGAVTGPCYETPAEIRALRMAGADAVGMSTAHESETGFRLGMECAAISSITNWAAGVTNEPLNHEEVLRTGSQQAQRLSEIIWGFLAKG